MNERRAFGLAALAALCVSGGVAAGLDAGRHVNAFYLVPQTPRYHSPPVVEAASTAWDWNEVPGYPIAPVPPPASPADAGTAERASFDDGLNDPAFRDPVFDEPPARAHRPVRVGRAARNDADDGPSDAPPAPETQQSGPQPGADPTPAPADDPMA